MVSDTEKPKVVEKPKEAEKPPKPLGKDYAKRRAELKAQAKKNTEKARKDKIAGLSFQ